MAIESRTSSEASEEELLHRASELVPVLKQRAARTEQLRQILPETVADVLASGLVRIGVPKRFGGLDVGYKLALDVAVELGRGCAATSWCYALWAVHAWLIGHWPVEAQEEVFANGPDMLSSSAFAPGGATADAVPGGLHLSGNWQFSSGCDAATWLMLGATGSDGPMWVLVPRPDYEIVDTWFVSGLRGTGSKDISIVDAFVPNHRILREPFTKGGLDSVGWKLHRQARYCLPVRCLLGWDLVAPIIGMAQAAIDEFTDRFHGTSGAGKSAESTVIQIRLAEASAEVDAARAVMSRDVLEMLAKGARAGRFSALEIARYGRDKAFASKLSVQAVERLFEVSGAHALFDSDPMQRIHRDIVAASHRDGQILDFGGQLYARLALGLDPNANIRR